MFDLTLILLFFILLVAVVSLVLILKNGQSNIEPQILNLKTAITSQLENQPEIVKLKIAEMLETKIGRIFNGLSEHNHSIKENFSSLQKEVIEQLKNNSELFNKTTHSFKDDIRKAQSSDFEKLSATVETRLEKISEKVRENLDEGFKKTNLTFSNVIERLAKIDEAQKKIDLLSSNVVSLQDILTDKKSRGIFGEVQLHQIISSIFGSKNDKIFQLQYKLPNETLVDAAIFLPEPHKMLAVDSKFPLENYKRMIDKNLSESEVQLSIKEFKKNVKKHIDDISSKYIIPTVTSDQAIMFLPAEAIFAEIHAYHDDIVDYANKKRVWIASPTTFIATLTTIQVVLNHIEQSKHASVIQEELKKLGGEFARYKERWDRLSKNIDTVNKSVKDLHVTSDKITKDFSRIAEVKFDETKDELIEILPDIQN